MARAPQPVGEGANFVRQIISDPKNVPDVTLLCGYLGASSEEGFERLYLSPDLSAFVEVPRAAILHRAQAARGQDPNVAVTLWVRKGAALKYKMGPAQQEAQQALAYYFAGTIQAGAAAAAALAPPRPTVPVQCGPPTIAGAACPQTQVGCPTRFGTCGVTCAATCAHCPPPTAGASCGCTNVVACPTLACPTFYPCTRIHVLCQTVGIYCTREPYCPSAVATCAGHWCTQESPCVTPCPP